MSNILKGIVTFEAPGLSQTVTQVNNAVLKTEAAFKKLTPAAGQATNSLTNLGRVVQDAPFGFIGIANNINPLLESFQRLKAETGSTGGALKALKSSLIGPAGLGLAVSAISSLLVVFGDKLFSASASMGKFSSVFKEAQGEFVSALSTVQNLTQQIQLAKDGFISKEGVVKKYNETIGKTTGLVSSLEEAERELINKGDAFIRVTLQKAIATEAYKRQAEKLFKVEENNIRLQNDAISGGKILNSIADIAKSKIESQNKSLQRQAEAYKKIGDNATENAGVLSDLYRLNFQGTNADVKIPGLKIKPDKLEIRPGIGSIQLELPTAFDAQTFLSPIQKQINQRENEIGLKIPITTDLSQPGKGFQNLLGKNQSFLKGIFDAEQQRLRALAGVVSDTLTPVFSSFFNTIASGGNAFKAFAQAAGQALTGLISKLLTTALLSAILGPLLGAGGAIGASSSKFGDVFKFLSGFGGARAAGGPVEAGKLYRVNERGMEFFRPNVGGSIIPVGGGSYSGGGGLGGRVVFEISGNKLIGVLANGGRSQRSLV